MQVVFRASFAKDLGRIRSKAVRQRLATVIQHVEGAAALDDVPNLRRLTATGPYYRIRMGDYRIGLVVEEDAVVFVRFLHRRDIYRYFP